MQWLVAHEGCDVVIDDIDTEPMNSVVEEIEKIGRRSISIIADVSDQ